MPVYQFEQKIPRLAGDVWLAPTATVIGDVILEQGVSLWWNAILRGDNDLIHIGENSNIQENCVLHTDVGFPLILASQVTVGHAVVLHGCNVGEGSLIGIGSILLNGSTIGKNSLVGANTLIPEGKSYPEGVLIVGSPGKIIRDLTDEEMLKLRRSAEHYVEKGRRFQTGLRLLP